MTDTSPNADAGQLTHFDATGQAHMVDVGPKNETHRVAVAAGTIRMKPDTLALIQSGNAKKGMCSASPASPPSWAPSAPAN